MKSPLDAAQTIVAELQGMTSENQSLALQFAMQTLRLAPPTAPQAPSPPAAHPHSPHVHPAASTPGQTTDIKTFSAAKAPQSDQQFAAVVAYYYQFEAKQSERKDVIDSATMKEAARLATRPQVKRWDTTLHNAARAGYLSLVGKGSFKLSPVGENLVAITLPGTVRGGSTNDGSGGRKAAKKKATAKKQAKRAG
jgi:hypothetical protein